VTTISGYPVVFDSLSEPMGAGGYTFVERVLAGAFREALAEKQDTRALMNHDPNLVLGRTRSGTLTLRETSRGLFAEFTPPDTQTVRDLLLAPLARGDISSWSFGFSIKEGGVRWVQEDGMDVRELRRLNLFDVSIVTFPAYSTTGGVDVREGSIARWTRTPERAPTYARSSRITTATELGQMLATRQRRYLTLIGGK
jgi:hypothetical protein